ncbi:MAG: cyclase family protein, partial [Acidobacteria bacterium]|nr:cyclase family protein [Acidobacteriota bacterium]
MTRGTYLKAAVVVAVLVLGIAGTYFLAGGLSEQGRPGEPLTVAQLEAWIDEYSNWGRWGEDDDLGAIQLITPEKRVQAASLVTAGVTVSLAELQIPNVEEPGRPTPYRFEFTFRENYEEYVMSNPWTAPPAERLIVGAHGGRSHLDALAHNFYNGQYYNGLPYTDITAEGTIRGGIENLRHGVVTRGILMDIPRLKGVPYLEPGEPIYPEDLDAWEEQAGVKVSAGDALFIHTGHFARHDALGPF